MGLTILALTLGLTGVILGTTGAVFAVLAYIELKALKNSTHNIQFVPVTEAAPAKTDDEVSKEFRKTGVMAEVFDDIPDEVIL